MGNGIPEYWLELVADTLKQVDVSVRGAFLQKFFQSLVGRGSTEEESIAHWEGVRARQIQLAEKLGHPVTLRTAVLIYFEEVNILQNPVLLEYEELKKLRVNAATDPLTGLNNRRLFEEYLDQEIDRSTRYGYPFSLLLFDLHKFKSVNDTYGHATGDEMLRTAARASLETIRASDIPCRTGGDEFAIILPQTGLPGSEVLAERIVRKFAAYAHSLAPGSQVAIDYGIAVFPEEGHDVPSLFASADRKLYASKQKAHDRSIDSPVPPQVTALGTETSTRPLEVEQAQGNGQRSPSPSAPAVPIKTEEKLTNSKRVPDGRRFERIRLDGAPAPGLVRVGGKSSMVKILDASLGGIGILVEQADLPETFQALVQVPILSGGELALERVYSLPLSGGMRRVGCRVTSIVCPK
jgi:diguanylate cyclase (GGDEF)-like protein